MDDEIPVQVLKATEDLEHDAFDLGGSTGWRALMHCLEVTGSLQSVAAAVSCTTKAVL